jgi:hypothetical protein
MEERKGRENEDRRLKEWTKGREDALLKERKYRELLEREMKIDKKVLEA